MSAKRKVFALLVGIDRYPSPVSALQSTHKDVRAFAQYLQNREDIDLKLIEMQDEKAQRGPLVQCLLAHLGQAQAGETALFYFAGHGGREWAHRRFADESPDGRSEGIVCYDSILPEGKGKGMLLDKELRYIFQQLAKKGAHLLSIFDCCHSGGNTRSQSQARLRTRQYPAPGSTDDTLPARNWSEYIFAKEYQEHSTEPIADEFLEGAHVQLAACLPRQRASEGDQGGLFTQALLDVLQHPKQLGSYRNVIMQVRQAFAKNQDQYPNYYVADQTGRLADAEFLLGMEAAYLFGHAPLRYDKKLGWVVDLGQNQGLQDNKCPIPVWDEQQNKYEARIAQLGVQTSQLLFTQSPTADRRCTGDFSQSLVRPLRLLWQMKEGDDPSSYRLLEALEEEPFLSWVYSPELADYGIFTNGRSWSIVRPGEQDALVRPIERTSSQSVNHLIGYLKHMARWHQLLHVADDSQQAGVRIRIAQHNEEGRAEEKPVQGHKVVLRYNQSYGGRPSGRIDIGIENLSNQQRYVALLYFDPHFMVYTRLIPEEVIALSQGEIYWRKNLRLTLEEEVEKYNWSASVSWLKVISASQPFAVDAYHLPDLPGPFAAATRAGRAELSDTQHGIQHQWETYRVQLEVRVK